MHHGCRAGQYFSIPPFLEYCNPAINEILLLVGLSSGQEACGRCIFGMWDRIFNIEWTVDAGFWIPALSASSDEPSLHLSHAVKEKRYRTSDKLLLLHDWRQVTDFRLTFNKLWSSISAIISAMLTSAFEKTPGPSSSEPSDHEDPGNSSEDDNAFSADSRQVPPSNDGVRVQNLSVLQLYSQPSLFLSGIPFIIFGPQFRFLSRSATPHTSRPATPTPFSSSTSSQVRTVRMFKVPENVKKTNEQGVRILAIDNGGIATFATLYMLQVVMLHVGELLGIPEGEEVRPCDIFDLICGTSTGGWIALMLGRLGMTVQESIRAYEQIIQHVFSEDAPLSEEGHRYSAQRLEAVFLDIIARHTPSSGLSTHLPMKDDAIADRCRTFVVSASESNAAVSTEMRTYDVSHAHARLFAAPCAVWEAARATSSHPGYFPPTVIDNMKFVAVGKNNPAALAIEESKRIWGKGSQVACLVSLGSGVAHAAQLYDITRLVEAIVEEEGSRVADQVKMSMQKRGLAHRYHRFAINTMGRIKWQEWEGYHAVVGRAKAYMDVMGYEAHSAAEYLVQVHSERIAIRRRLPLPPPGSCFGREAEVQLAREAILTGRHVAIMGGAGNGKSIVALHTLHLKEIEQSFADLKGGTKEDLRFWTRTQNSTSSELFFRTTQSGRCSS
ncbi:FabD/lysophospholipase-like protein [Atractiella rhizophila]|nr:FabD/lysophospholipase-like protein [Atractiella rhizophila]